MPLHRIETQDLLIKELAINNVVEIGPSNTLINMMKRTLQNKNYRRHDAALGLSRKLLSYKDHAREINHGLTADSDLKDNSKHSASSEKKEKPHAVPPPARQEPAVDVVPASEQSAMLVAGSVVAGKPTVEVVLTPKIVDTPVTATDIVVAIISQKLNKSLDEKDLGKSITHLCGGETKASSQDTLINISHHRTFYPSE